MISACDSVSCHCENGKVSIMKVLLGSAIPGLNTVLGEADATHSDLKHAGKSYFFTGMKKAKSIIMLATSSIDQGENTRP